MDMKKLLLTVMVLIAALGAVTGEIKAAEKLDSLSYAFGQEFTLASMAGENDLMRTRKDFVDYVKGLEDEFNNLKQLNDSSAVISYYIGYWLMPSFSNRDDVYQDDIVNRNKILASYDCIISGLRKTAKGDASLPADTINLPSMISQYGTDSIRPVNRSLCEFYTAYGIKLAYQPGLQKFLEGINPGTHCTVNRQAFATGMADCLESARVPDTTYDFAKGMARVIFMNSLSMKKPLDFQSVVDGAKGALGLSVPLIPRYEAEQVFDKYSHSAAARDDSGIIE